MVYGRWTMVDRLKRKNYESYIKNLETKRLKS